MDKTDRDHAGLRQDQAAVIQAASHSLLNNKTKNVDRPQHKVRVRPVKLKRPESLQNANPGNKPIHIDPQKLKKGSTA